ncbi:hypothetical protein L227DRAFT_63234 [Lentinus tigrinus ALCF2SS1-6]|uniref:Uncharacterized protein n=1 Tax=Lentinus tigrinus ALCF2SS1-6 TaxID=1328759 RepID=A0A5C2SC27_9APHY|nr:hypothetical protein L227DRAFT_63234 [Lentinus tigrinus ALCF2SS1-6]
MKSRGGARGWPCTVQVAMSVHPYRLLDNPRELEGALFISVPSFLSSLPIHPKASPWPQDFRERLRVSTGRHLWFYTLVSIQPPIPRTFHVYTASNERPYQTTLPWCAWTMRPSTVRSGAPWKFEVEPQRRSSMTHLLFNPLTQTDRDGHVLLVWQRSAIGVSSRIEVVCPDSLAGWLHERRGLLVVDAIGQRGATGHWHSTPDLWACCVGRSQGIGLRELKKITARC